MCRAAWLTTQTQRELECNKLVCRRRGVHILPLHHICHTKHQIASVATKTCSMVKQMTYGYILDALILILGKLLQDTLLAKNLVVESQHTLIAELHNSHSCNEFRCRGYAVDVTHLCLSLHLLISPAEALAVDKLLVTHHRKRSTLDAVASHPAFDISLHRLHCGQVGDSIAERVVKAIAILLLLRNLHDTVS